MSVPMCHVGDWHVTCEAVPAFPPLMGAKIREAMRVWGCCMHQATWRMTCTQSIAVGYGFCFVVAEAESNNPIWGPWARWPFDGMVLAQSSRTFIVRPNSSTWKSSRQSLAAATLMTTMTATLIVLAPYVIWHTEGGYVKIQQVLDKAGKHAKNLASGTRRESVTIADWMIWRKETWYSWHASLARCGPSLTLRRRINLKLKNLLLPCPARKKLLALTGRQRCINGCNQLPLWRFLWTHQIAQQREVLMALTQVPPRERMLAAIVDRLVTQGSWISTMVQTSVVSPILEVPPISQKQSLSKLIYLSPRRRSLGRLPWRLEDNELNADQAEIVEFHNHSVVQVPGKPLGMTNLQKCSTGGLQFPKVSMTWSMWLAYQGEQSYLSDADSGVNLGCIHGGKLQANTWWHEVWQGRESIPKLGNGPRNLGHLRYTGFGEEHVLDRQAGQCLGQLPCKSKRSGLSSGWPEDMLQENLIDQAHGPCRSEEVWAFYVAWPVFGSVREASESRYEAETDYQWLSNGIGSSHWFRWIHGWSCGLCSEWFTECYTAGDDCQVVCPRWLRLHRFSDSAKA